MAKEDGKVVFKYVGDTSGVDKANNEAEHKIKGFGSRIGGIAKGIGTAIAGALAAAGVALLGLAKRGLGLASDLQEVQNVVDVTFGDGAKVIDEFAKTADKAFGLSELQVKSFTGTMGAMLKSMGLTEEQTVDMSKQLAGLTGDMASFYNLNHDDAWGKIRSGIAGETEPLKQLGINMSVANLEAFALTQGITKSYDAMTEAEKVTLRYNYLLSTTADAQGDFARTSDGWANQLRTAKMNVDDLAASFGETLLPALQPVLKAFNDTAVPKLQEVFEKMAEDGTLDKLGEALGKIAELFSGVLAETLPVVVELLSELLPVIAEIAETILPPILDIIKQLGPLLDVVMELLGPLIKMLSGGLAVALGIVADALSIIVGLIGLVIEGLKALAGQPTDFDTYLNMIRRPFSEQGSTYQAAQAQIESMYGDLGISITPTPTATATAPTGPSDADLTDQEWYDLYFGSGANTRGVPSYNDAAAMATVPNVSTHSESMSIGQLNVYPDSKDYMRMLQVVESSERARQDGRAGGNY